MVIHATRRVNRQTQISGGFDLLATWSSRRPGGYSGCTDPVKGALVPHLPVADRRRQFIEAAIEVIANEGVARATTRRIAQQANAPAASLHYCFDTKEELFQAVFEHGSTDGVRHAGRDIRPGMGLSRAVEAILNGYLEWMLADKNLQQAQYELIFWALRSPTSRHLPQRTYRAYIDATNQLLREASTPEDVGANLEFLSRQIIAVLDGHALQWMALGDGAMTQVIENAIIEIQASLVQTRAAAS